MHYLAFIFGSFFIGSLPFAFWIGRYFYKIDIRNFGSNNPGATNAWRVLGPRAGAFALLADTAKGAIPVALAKHYDVDYLPIVAGASAILGHTYSPWLSFKGGKGVATALGVCLSLVPLISFFLFLIFSLAVALTRYISLGSILAAIVFPLLVLLIPTPEGMLVFSLLIAGLVIYRHRANVKRLLAGTESRFTFSTNNRNT